MNTVCPVKYRSRIPVDRLHRGEPLLENHEDPRIVQTVFIRPTGRKRSILLPVPKGTLPEGRDEGKTVVSVMVPILPIFASLLRK